MNWQAWFTLAVTAGALALLVRERFSPANTLLGAVITLLIAKVITPAEAFAGFGNSAPITVAALYVLARAVEKTGLFQPVMAAILGGRAANARPRRSALARLSVSSAAASAFLNNTPLVAMLIPPVSDWAQRTGQPPSRYLMPLSYAVILGGVVTLIGTSTNLVVSGMLDAKTGEAMHMFEITPIGLPVAIVGVAVMVLTARRLLPVRHAARSDLIETSREFTVTMVVRPGGPMDGATVDAAGLRGLKGVFLVEVVRGDAVIAPVSSSTVLRGGDGLLFVGRVDEIVDLQAMRGLTSAEEAHFSSFSSAHHTFFEAVIGVASPLVGKTLREIEFRSRYQAAVVAIHRAGHRINEKLGSVELRAGDTMLLLSDPDFRARWRDRPDFLLVSPLGGSPPAVARKAGLVGVIMALVVLVAGSGLLPMLQVALLAAVAMVMFRVLTAIEARNAVDLDVIIMIAASFGLGTAMEKSGLADKLASGLVGVFDGFGPLGVLLGIILATSLLTELVTNNAAAAILFPIAYATALQIGQDPRLFGIVVAVMASTSFLTPIGYQTNTMVYGPGGYRFGDYARLGGPITVVVMIMILVVARFWYGVGR